MNIRLYFEVLNFFFEYEVYGLGLYEMTPVTPDSRPDHLSSIGKWQEARGERNGAALNCK